MSNPSWSRRIALARLTADEAGNLLNFCPFVRIRAMPDAKRRVAPTGIASQVFYRAPASSADDPDLRNEPAEMNAASQHGFRLKTKTISVFVGPVLANYTIEFSFRHHRSSSSSVQTVFTPSPESRRRCTSFRCRLFFVVSWLREAF